MSGRRVCGPELMMSWRIGYTGCVFDSLVVGGIGNLAAGFVGLLVIIE